jgi:hypothetical protein
MLRKYVFGVLVLALISSRPAPAQTTVSGAQNSTKDQTAQVQQDSGGNNSTPGGTTNGSTSAPAAAATTAAVSQPKRILGIFPNFRAVSTDAQVSPLSVKGKFWLATQSSFDYSAFLTSGIFSGIGQLNNSDKEFGQGGVGYGRRYWHWMAANATGNYLTEAILPAALGEDPRYYTLGRGGVLHRTGYAISRLAVTKRDSGRWAPSFSEIPGNGIAAAISVHYFPSSQRGWVKTYQIWLSSLAVDGASNILKEFWPDISSKLPGFGRKSGSNSTP